ncbi:MAG TPA: 4Fe-4S dicluster domain-containing protein [Thermococcus paralvinellae]|uniref:4Fe-4S dicluster domain-containing protein n=1 Tax=Thermococcus paralvinellae TaxID=582419 RepID=A0A832ZDC7_9EURY|nr:4Fe-4S dicluster domain-containing protein [Thermococcus paralvinellae]
MSFLPINSDLEKPTIYINPEKCIGCRSCEVACAVEHSMSKNLFGAIFEKPTPKPRIKVVVADFFNVPMRCQHCEDAPCERVCPTGAIEKSEEGFVLLNSNKCIGCLMCVMACPFGHPKYETEYKVVLKCDFCVDRIREGNEPACVEACPTRALKFGTLEELLDEIRRDRAEQFISGLKVPGLIYTKPVSEEKRGEEKVRLMDLYMAYSKVKWY